MHVNSTWELIHKKKDYPAAVSIKSCLTRPFSDLCASVIDFSTIYSKGSLVDLWIILFLAMLVFIASSICHARFTFSDIFVINNPIISAGVSSKLWSYAVCLRNVRMIYHRSHYNIQYPCISTYDIKSSNSLSTEKCYLLKFGNLP